MNRVVLLPVLLLLLVTLSFYTHGVHAEICGNYVSPSACAAAPGASCVWDTASYMCKSATVPLPPGPPSACSTHTTETSCYEWRGQCRWSPFSNACEEGPATTCEQLHRSPYSCDGSCGRNLFNGVCFKLPMLPPVSPTCNSFTDVQTCIANKCYYDVYFPSTTSTAGKCVASLAESKSIFPSCHTYSLYPTNVFADACSNARVCTPLAFSNLCDNPSSQSTDDVLAANRVNTQFVFELQGPSIDLQNYNFEIRNWIPLGQFLNSTEPVLHTLSFGPTNQLPRPLQPNKCNDLLVARPALGSGLPRVFPAYEDTTALKNTLAASTNLVFTGDAATTTALYQMVGYSKVGGESIVRDVVVTGSNVIKHALANSNWLVENCGSTRAVVSTDETRYTHTLTLDVQSANYAASTSMYVFNSIYTYGLAFFGATQRAALRIFVYAPADTAEGALVAGTMKRSFTVDLVYRTTNPNVMIGLRSFEDVSMIKTGGSGQTIPPTNCFGTRPVHVKPPSGQPTVCPTTDIPATTPPTYCWTSVVTFETRYNDPTDDEDGLTVCSKQPADVRIAEMGGDIPYPTQLNARHDFYHFPKQWALGASGTGPFTPVGSDPTGSVGDPLYVRLDQKTPRALTIDNTLDAPQCGILPLPTSPISDLILPVNSENGLAVDLRNSALQSGSLLIFACYDRDASRRTTTMLSFKESLYLLPLDTTGQIINNALGQPLATLPFEDFAAAVPFTIRSVNGAHVSAVNAELGVDAFGVVIRDVMTRMAANGFGPTIPFFRTLPTTSTPARRRLLQTGQVEGMVSFRVLLPENATNQFYVPSGSSKNADVALSVSVVLLGSVLLAVSSAALLSAYSATSYVVTHASTAKLLTSSSTPSTAGKRRASSAHHMSTRSSTVSSPSTSHKKTASQGSTPASRRSSQNSYLTVTSYDSDDGAQSL